MSIKIDKALVKKSNIGIVVAEFNKEITARLLDGCVKKLLASGVLKNNIQVVWVPGAFEIPLAAKRLASKKTVDAVITLGAVIKGETLHYELVSYATAYGIQKIALEQNKPIIYEVLACSTVKYAQERAKADGYNKGEVAAQTVIETLCSLKTIR